MKTTSLKTLLGGAAVAGTLMFMPVAASALDANATTSSSLRINRDGAVKIVNAEVTSVTGNVINAITRFKNTVVNWAFSTNASTTVDVANATTPTNDVLAGDRINVVGTVTTFGSFLGLNATAIKSFMPELKERTATSTKLANGISGKITGVNTANGTFTMKTSKDRLVTVQTNASTTFKLAKATGTVTLASLANGSKVTVVGTANADGTVIVATQVIAKLDDDKNRDKDRKENKGSSHGLKNGWKDKEDRDNRGEHRGFLKTVLDIKAEDASDDR